MEELEPTEPEPTPEPGEELVEVEVVDALPVLEPPRQVSLLPALQTATAAATGFIVGAATLALLRRRDIRRIARELGDLKGRYDAVPRPARFPLEPGRSYLVHVRVVSRPPFTPPPVTPSAE